MPKKYGIFLPLFIFFLSSLPTMAMDSVEDKDFPQSIMKALHNKKEATSAREEEKNLGSEGVTRLELEISPHPGSLPHEHLLEFLGGFTPTFLSRLNYFLKYQLGGWNNAVRIGQSSYQVIAMSGSIGGPAPKTPEDGKKWANNIISSITSFPTMKTVRSDRTTFLTMHEFAANGGIVKDPENDRQGKWRYGADKVLFLETYNVLKATISRCMKTMPPGYVFVMGGTAVDTGKRDLLSGKQLGKNVGFICISGSSEIIEIRKRWSDPLDGWDEEGFQVPQEGAGYTTVSLEKIIPGNKDYFAVSICRDAAEISFLPENPLLYFILSAGAPNSRKIVPTNPQASKVIIDSKQFPDSELVGGNYYNNVLYELSPQKNPSLISKVLGYTKDFWTVTPQQAQKALQSYTGVGQMRFQYKEGGTVIITKPRPFPSQMTETTLNENIADMVENQSTILDQRNDPPDSSSIEDAGDRTFDQTLTATPEQAREAESNFGEEGEI